MLINPIKNFINYNLQFLFVRPELGVGLYASIYAHGSNFKQSHTTRRLRNAALIYLVRYSLDWGGANCLIAMGVYRVGQGGSCPPPLAGQKCNVFRLFLGKILFVAFLAKSRFPPLEKGLRTPMPIAFFWLPYWYRIPLPYPTGEMEIHPLSK